MYKQIFKKEMAGISQDRERSRYKREFLQNQTFFYRRRGCFTKFVNWLHIKIGMVQKV